MKKIYRVEGLDCANCAAKAERGVSAIDGVSDANINFLTMKMILECDETRIDEIEKQAFKILRRIEPDIMIKAI